MFNNFGPVLGAKKRNIYEVLEDEMLPDKKKHYKNTKRFVSLQNLNQNPTSIQDGPKYLVMSSTDAEKPLSKLCSLKIKHSLTALCSSLTKTTRMKNGDILILTKNSKQVNYLLSQKELPNLCPIVIKKHDKLNFTKGTIYCKDLQNSTVEDIKEELKHLQVTKVENIKRFKDGTLSPTPLYVITFESLTLPNEIDLGFYKLKVQKFFPEPLKCRNCLRLGHTKKWCKSPELCENCTKNVHVNVETNEVCDQEKKCINCSSNSHKSLDKLCPKFIERKEIIKIKTEENCSYIQAQKKYHYYKSLIPQQKLLYSESTKNNSNSPNNTSQTNVILSNNQSNTQSNTQQNSQQNSHQNSQQKNNQQNTQTSLNNTNEINSVQDLNDNNTTQNAQSASHIIKNNKEILTISLNKINPPTFSEKTNIHTTNQSTVLPNNIHTKINSNLTNITNTSNSNKSINSNTTSIAPHSPN